jgi:hypothetical protein
MKPRSKYNRKPVQIHKVNRPYALGGKRLHTGGSLLVQGKPMHGQTICFTHQTAQHICHCDSLDQISVGDLTRIPPKGHEAAWKRLRAHLEPLRKAQQLKRDAAAQREFAKTVPGYQV